MIELPPIRESTEDYDVIERKIIALFLKEVYHPLLKSLGYNRKIMNASEVLLEAIQTGRISYSGGEFSGRFSSSTSKELKSLGARWDRKHGTWKIAQSSLPLDVRNAVSSSEARFRAKIAGIDRRLSQLQPAEIAEKLHIAPQFDTALWRVDRDFKKSVKVLGIDPKLSDEGRKKVSEEWQDNMKLWVQKFTEKEIASLRQKVQASVFAGNRREAMVKTIQASYGVTRAKAKFLARQETSLLMAKYKETKYTAAGVNQYRWGCVKMPHQPRGAPAKPGEVRYHHGVLEGKIFSFDNPPVTDDKGSRNNAGQDYYCRCFAIPIVKF